MTFSKEQIEEFRQEVIDYLLEANSQLKYLTNSGNNRSHFVTFFRLLLNIKGTSLFLEIPALQAHMDKVLSLFDQIKNLTALNEETAAFFQKALDRADDLLAGKEISFNYVLPEGATASSASTTGSESKKETLDALKIMIIDDEPDIVDILEGHVRDAGFIPVPFTDPILALKNLKKEKPSAVLTDVKMAQMSGFDVLKEISKIDDDLPVVFISGHLSKQQVIDAFSLGVSGVIEKPFDGNHVVEVCKNVTQKCILGRLLKSSISFIYYYYAHLDESLKDKGDESTRKLMHEQFKTLLETRRKLKAIRNS